ncbi:ABC transporter ATP-binding protein [Rhodobacteraceae bacterium NNCM2]|nr:ABC transporter ATP-binding protein [Coraliihabitans acroporae]
MRAPREGWFEGLFDPYSQSDNPPPQSLGSFMRWMLRGSERAIGLLGLTSLALGIAEAVAAWLIGWLIDQATDTTPSAFFQEYWAQTLLVLLFFFLVRPVLMILSSGFVSRTLGPGLFHLGVWRLHRHTLGQSLKFFEDDFAGRISQKQIQTAGELTDAVTEFMNAMAYGLAAVIGAALVLGGADLWLLVGLGVWFGFYLYIVSWFLPRIRVLSKERAEARAALSGQIVDSLSHITTVKLFAHAGREEEAARAALARFRERALAFGHAVWQFRAGLSTLSGALPVMLIATALVLWSSGQTTTGVIAMAALLSTRLSQMSGWVSFTAMTIFSNIGTVEDGMRTLAPSHDMVDRPTAREPEDVRGHLRFENVTFQYGLEEARSGGGVEGLTLDIKPGERVGLVGASGAGKSTTISLLLRLYDVEEGRITLDGVDLRDLTQDGLRRQIATVTQEPAMFNRSALENILYGRPEAGRAAAIEAAKKAEADSFIRDLRDFRGRTGYDAHLGERGVRLSGGQRQRIALARAVLKDAPILVLDEATSALDSEVEASIQTALQRLMRGKTVIAIAHRLSTIQRMDRIVVLDAGRIAEQGSHDELIARDGLYARFWARQSGGMIGADAA